MKSKKIQFRVSPAEYDALKLKADRDHGGSISKAARALLFDQQVKLKKTERDQRQKNPSCDN